MSERDDRIFNFALCVVNAALFLFFLAAAIAICLTVPRMEKWMAFPMALFAILTGAAAITRPWR